MNKTIIFDEKSCQWSKNELVNAWTLGAYECRLNDHLQTRGYLLLRDGMSPKTLQKILGHSSLQMTMDLYCHVSDETLFDEMKKMENQNGVKVV